MLKGRTQGEFRENLGRKLGESREKQGESREKYPNFAAPIQTRDRTGKFQPDRKGQTVIFITFT